MRASKPCSNKQRPVRSRRGFLKRAAVVSAMPLLPVAILRRSGLPARPRRQARLSGSGARLGKGTFRLSESASFILSRCNGKRTVEQIAAELVAEYDVDACTAKRDVLSCLHLCHRVGLIA